ncbi:GIY-YIG nuclease family protein [Mycobacterium paraffinicum]|uniref:GIY-YIG nuclease family protein n=1 Tax=Mycobacterium paraffinicum TaxID=53378 RepID=UPI0021F38E0A|nr:GIY-YIG nuclease family protein [Mycobacterium paraffinicum]MCV7311911.1 GIY-YIG nuclease family protein [Mycobacterium paraffinicum]
MARPQTIQIYLPSGNPAGIRIASLTTRTVRLFDVPRSLLSEFLREPESKQVGLYFLFGAAETDERPQAYVGQSGNVGFRLQQHATSKDFWNKAMVAVSLTNEWTSTHVAFLEWLSVSRATLVGRYELLNGNQASNPYTPKPLEADCIEFLDTVGVLMATLGAPILEEVQRSSGYPASGGKPKKGQDQDLLYFREAGCNATGYQTSEGLYVLAGSTGREDLRPSAPAWVERLRDALREQGIWEIRDGRLVLLKDHLFSSPSAAGGFVVGGTNNGRTSWKNSAGQDLNAIEARELSAASGLSVQATGEAEATAHTVPANPPQ